jgi:aryl-alcohol dehydrogenase-like predicted oxidoreductase
MKKYRVGGTDILAGKICFGALPLQRTEKEEAVRILRRAYDGGINFYDTARFYTDSESKIGAALSGVRGDIYIASKVSGARNGKQVEELTNASLRELQTDYVDVMQFHNPDFVPRPGGEDGMYDALSAAKAAGKIRWIGYTNHKITLAREAALSGLYDTIQYPLSYLSAPEELALPGLCGERGVGFLGMKPLAGGLLNNAGAVYHFFEGYADTCRPLYGIQHMRELEEFLALEKDPPAGEEVERIMEKDRRELGGEFCRGCGYCLPCAAGIDLPMVLRAALLLRRAPVREFVGDDWYEKMQKTRDCISCGQCGPRCPYGFKPQSRLDGQYEDFMRIHADYWSKHPAGK